MCTIKHLKLDYAKVRKAQFILEALQNSRRQRIIDLLEDFGELKADRLAYELNLDLDITNQHLAALRRTGVIELVRHNREIYYHLKTERLTQIVGAVDRFLYKTDPVLLELI